jgi:drug/metabolite transporter (DMT)-like permease
MLNDNLRGALWIVLSGAVATVMSSGIKALDGEIPSMQIAFLRCAIGVLLVLPLVFGRHIRQNMGLPPERTVSLRSRMQLSPHWPLLLVRGLLAAAAINCGYYAISQMPLTTVTVLFFTAPLFVTLFAVPFLGETVGWRRWCATGVGFLGTLIVLGPGSGHFALPALVAVGSSLLFAGALVIGKKLSAAEAPTTLLLYTTVITAVGSLPLALMVWVTPSLEQIGFIAIITFFATGRTYSDIRAYASGEASFVAPFTYVRLIFMALAGYFLFAEVPQPSALMGGGVIIASSLYIARREALRKRSLSRRPFVGPSPH